MKNYIFYEELKRSMENGFQEGVNSILRVTITFIFGIITYVIKDLISSEERYIFYSVEVIVFSIIIAITYKPVRNFIKGFWFDCFGKSDKEIKSKTIIEFKGNYSKYYNELLLILLTLREEKNNIDNIIYFLEMKSEYLKKQEIILNRLRKYKKIKEDNFLNKNFLKCNNVFEDIYDIVENISQNNSKINDLKVLIFSPKNSS